MYLGIITAELGTGEGQLAAIVGHLILDLPVVHPLGHQRRVS
jgi:hypothetical protein